MPGLVHFIVAVEILLLPLWVGAVMARPLASGIPNLESRGIDAKSLVRRLAWACAPVLLVAAPCIGLAALAEEPLVAGALRAQGVALGFAVLLAGVAAIARRAFGGTVAAQALTALVGWLVAGGIILAGPLAELVRGEAQEILVRALVEASPLVAAERELGLDWLHQELTYRLTPLGESFSLYVRDAAWYRTLLAHLFVGSGLLVFSIPRSRTR